MPLLTSLLILKDMEFQNGSLTETKIIKKERIFKSHPTSSKLNSEKTLKECIKSDVTGVADINGDSRLEDSILRLLDVLEKLLVYKERKNDRRYSNLY